MSATNDIQLDDALAEDTAIDTVAHDLAADACEAAQFIVDHQLVSALAQILQSSCKLTSIAYALKDHASEQLWQRHLRMF